MFSFFMVRGYAIRVRSQGNNCKLRILQGPTATFVKRCMERETRKVGQWLPSSSRQSAMPYVVSDPQVFVSSFLSVHVRHTLRIYDFPKIKTMLKCFNTVLLLGVLSQLLSSPLNYVYLFLIPTCKIKFCQSSVSLITTKLIVQIHC